MARRKRIIELVVIWAVTPLPLVALMVAHKFFDTLELAPYLICLGCGVIVFLVASALIWAVCRTDGRLLPVMFLFWCCPTGAVLAGLAWNARLDQSPLVAHRTTVLDWVVSAKRRGHCDVVSWRRPGREEIAPEFVVSPVVPTGVVLSGAAREEASDVPGARTRADTPPPRACTPGRAITVYTRAGRLGWERVVGVGA